MPLTCIGDDAAHGGAAACLQACLLLSGDDAVRPSLMTSERQTCRLTALSRHFCVRPLRSWCSWLHSFMPSRTSSEWWIAMSGPCNAATAGHDYEAAITSRICASYQPRSNDIVHRSQPV